MTYQHSPISNTPLIFYSRNTAMPLTKTAGWPEPD